MHRNSAPVCCSRYNICLRFPPIRKFGRACCIGRDWLCKVINHSILGLYLVWSPQAGCDPKSSQIAQTIIAVVDALRRTCDYPLLTLPMACVYDSAHGVQPGRIREIYWVTTD